MRFLLMFVLVVGISSADSKWKPKYTIPKNALTCDVCKALMTGIDSWITSDKTEQDIIDFFNQICEFADTLIPGLGQTCTDFLNNNMQGIIESIVHEDLDPEEVCTNFGLCP